KNVADGDDSPAVTTSLTGTAVPPALPNVSTLASADAGPAGNKAIIDATNAVIARYTYLRMPLTSCGLASPPRPAQGDRFPGSVPVRTSTSPCDRTNPLSPWQSPEYYYRVAVRSRQDRNVYIP